VDFFAPREVDGLERDDQRIPKLDGRIMALTGPEERDDAMQHFVEALDPLELDTLRTRIAVER
jgi:hypothetical protein